MKAMASKGYGPLDQLALIDLPLPTPGAGEVRVRVVASALNPADFKVLTGEMKFLHGRKLPLLLGYDFSGTIDAVGLGATGFAVGDAVFGFLPYAPTSNRGAFAEALIAKCSEIAIKPPGVSHEVAAASATTGLTALQSLRDLGRLPATGGQALVTGVSGGVGSIAVGIAQKLGATVTALGSGVGLGLAKRLGAVAVIDRTAGTVPGDIAARFDVVFDPSAAYRWQKWRQVLKPGGAFVTTLPSGAFAADKLHSLFTGSRVHFVSVKAKSADLKLLGEWLASGLEVPLAATIDVRDLAQGLARLQRSGGRIAVRVAEGF